MGGSGWKELHPSHDFYADLCTKATSTFLVMYLEAMLEAKQSGNMKAFYLCQNINKDFSQAKYTVHEIPEFVIAIIITKE